MKNQIDKYHRNQWRKQKESTKEFLTFFQNEISRSTQLLDLGCGAGAVTTFLAKRFPETKFIGIDNSADLIEEARFMSSKCQLKNLKFQIGDWNNLDKNWENVDGVISVATLSWLPEMIKPMSALFGTVKPQWIGLSSLFYEGEISCRIEVNEHKRDRVSFYNVYSIRELERLANKYDYKVSRFQSFEIGIDIAKPKDIDSMGTYTVRIEESMRIKRLQLSGPLNMPWCFVLLTRD
jgi:SAM-dependent methyltransferase